MKRAIAEGAVGVWRVSTDAAVPWEWLGEDERARAERLRNEDARTRFVACRAALRAILGDLEGVSPSDLVFGAGEYGKPFIEAPDSMLRFNTAHSGTKAIIAVTDNLEVGVDLEGVDPERDMEAIAHRYFRPEEYTALARFSDAERPRVFTELWTRKEAYLKARGTGIRGGLASFSVAVPPDPPRLVSGADMGAWSFVPIDCGEGYAATICAAGRPLHVLVRDWDGSSAGR